MTRTTTRWLDRCACWLEERLKGTWALVPPWMR